VAGQSGAVKVVFDDKIAAAVHDSVERSLGELSARDRARLHRRSGRISFVEFSPPQRQLSLQSLTRTQ
jgi:hypothetical protein